MSEDDLELENEEDSSIKFEFLSETPNEARPEHSIDLQYIKWTHDLSTEICTIVYELLSKQTNADLIQNELVELLGFENIELTGYLITNREQVVKSYKKFLIDGNKPGVIRKKQTNTWDTSENNLKQSKLAGFNLKNFLNF